MGWLFCFEKLKIWGMVSEKNGPVRATQAISLWIFHLPPKWGMYLKISRGNFQKRISYDTDRGLPWFYDTIWPF